MQSPYVQDTDWYSMETRREIKYNLKNLKKPSQLFTTRATNATAILIPFLSASLKQKQVMATEEKWNRISTAGVLF